MSPVFHKFCSCKHKTNGPLPPEVTNHLPLKTIWYKVLFSALSVYNERDLGNHGSRQLNTESMAQALGEYQ